MRNYADDSVIDFFKSYRILDTEFNGAHVAIRLLDLYDEKPRCEKCRGKYVCKPCPGECNVSDEEIDVCFCTQNKEEKDTASCSDSINYPAEDICDCSECKPIGVVSDICDFVRYRIEKSYGGQILNTKRLPKIRGNLKYRTHCNIDNDFNFLKSLGYKFPLNIINLGRKKRRMYPEDCECWPPKPEFDVELDTIYYFIIKASRKKEGKLVQEIELRPPMPPARYLPIFKTQYSQFPESRSSLRSKRRRTKGKGRICRRDYPYRADYPC